MSRAFDERLAAIEVEIATLRAEHDALLSAVGASLRRHGVRVRPIAPQTAEDLDARVEAVKSAMRKHSRFATALPGAAALRVACLNGTIAADGSIEPLPVEEIVRHFEACADRAFPGHADAIGARYGGHATGLDDAVELAHSSRIASPPAATEPVLTDAAEAGRRLVGNRVRWDGTDVSYGWDERARLAKTPIANRPDAWRDVRDDTWEFVVLSGLANPFAVTLGRPERPRWPADATPQDVIDAERVRRGLP